MKWFALLLLGVLAAVGVAQECDTTLTVTTQVAANEFAAAASSVPTLNIRNTVAAAETFKNRYITIHNDYGVVIGSTDENQVSQISQNLIAALETGYTNLENSIKQTPYRSARSHSVDRDLDRLNEQIEAVLELKPGTQRVRSNLRELPPKPEFASDNRNLTVSQAFLQFAETKDAEWAAVGEYAAALHWYGWRRARESFDTRQTQMRNRYLNDQVLPVYRRIVDRVYSRYNTIRNFIGQETWGRFVRARQSIVSASDSYRQAIERGECL